LKECEPPSGQSKHDAGYKATASGFRGKVTLIAGYILIDQPVMDGGFSRFAAKPLALRCRVCPRHGDGVDLAIDFSGFFWDKAWEIGGAKAKQIVL
jgi:hypothetical protein